MNINKHQWAIKSIIGGLGVAMILWGCGEENAVTEPKQTLPVLMAKQLEDTLKNSGIGYAFTIYEGTKIMAQGSGGLKSTVNDAGGQKAFTVDTKLHIASMSKTLTAMAFLKAAQQKGLRTTNKIANYLPSNWPKGAGIDQITFGDLLTHQSGIRGLGNNCQNGAFSENVYSGLKQLIGKGASRGSYCYQNANFGLFRVLIPSIMGYQFTGDDNVDDTETQKLYLSFLQKELFEKINLQNVSPFPTGEITYTYNYPLTASQSGWNPGNFSATMGGYGLYLTAAEAGSVYASALSSTDNTVLSPALADSLLIKNLGSYKATSSAGTYYYHDGWWYEYLGQNGRGLRTIWMKFPQNITCVLFVNALRYQNGSLGFPFNSGSILIFVYNAYTKAIQAKNLRQSAEVPPLRVEHPEPH
ncbi:serine hydrolase [Runella sp. MFBS21]|uniref:serine hydrolase domain-containing protein n=1 Tax=Runella sp. MFBS21 TaxID=3034018 RepID=UPI0023F9A17F|nr:serine hydrolase domain-containing protein [Runella sp. MFBS21]MDF7820437.1 serine hydrolase [Runella sp. MFBS21]